MKQTILAILFLILVASFAYSASWFPITAWGIKYDDISCTTWVKEVALQWHGNSVHCEVGFPPIRSITAPFWGLFCSVKGVEVGKIHCTPQKRVKNVS